jgi:hypothetical protein|tara:strand:+ start:190 stop:330 length:141 start_codon:yes stop_codon:yes gene_type:complete
MEKFQDPRPIEQLASNATVAKRIAKINELVAVLNELLFTDEQTHTE